MTIDELKSEIDRLKKELAEAKAEEKRKKERTRRRLPESLVEKYDDKRIPVPFPDRTPEEWITPFLFAANIAELSRIIRNVMFVHLTEAEVGRPFPRIQQRIERYSKPFADMTDEEYENYAACLDEVLQVLQKYDIKKAACAATQDG